MCATTGEATSTAGCLRSCCDVSGSVSRVSLGSVALPYFGSVVDTVLLQLVWESRGGRPYGSMQYAFRGHVVVLINEETASDGEAFAEGARRLGIATIIGTRTWGGEIWLSVGVNKKMLARQCSRCTHCSRTIS